MQNLNYHRGVGQDIDGCRSIYIYQASRILLEEVRFIQRRTRCRWGFPQNRLIFQSKTHQNCLDKIASYICTVRCCRPQVSAPLSPTWMPRRISKTIMITTSTTRTYDRLYLSRLLFSGLHSLINYRYLGRILTISRYTNPQVEMGFPRWSELHRRWGSFLCC
jgi:hypothetical protein